MPLKRLAIFTLAAFVAGCNTQGDLTRGAIGATAGCLAGELIDDACVEGAIVGGVGGVVANDVGF